MTESGMPNIWVKVHPKMRRIGKVGRVHCRRRGALPADYQYRASQLSPE